MSELGEDFKALSDHLKEMRKEREVKNSDIICGWCNENDAEYKEIAHYHIRVNKNGKSIDIFPQSKKYHDLKNNKRGRINGIIVTFLSTHFNKK
jgi:hypothetical protein